MNIAATSGARKTAQGNNLSGFSYFLVSDLRFSATPMGTNQAGCVLRVLSI
jgi:hypothetical protein